MTDYDKGILEIKAELREEILAEIVPPLKKEIADQISGLAEMLHHQQPHSATEPMQQPQAALGFTEILTAFKMLNEIQGKPPTIADQIAVLKEVRTAFAPVESSESMGDPEEPEDKIMGKILDALIAKQTPTPTQTPTPPAKHTPSQEEESKTEIPQTSREEIRYLIDNAPENQKKMMRMYAEDHTDQDILKTLNNSGFRIKPEDIDYAKECLGINSHNSHKKEKTTKEVDKK